jgi:chemotaxis protein methyltransferase WspC
MSLPGIEAVVRIQLGLDPESLGAAALPRAVEKRMSVVGAASTDDYLVSLTRDSVERDALAAELAVPETWFFRGGHELFDALAEFVAARAGQRPPDAPIRILSVPCSTGEEPFSLAIALDQHQVPPAAYRIEGVDLSLPALARAAKGRFSSFAFREAGPDVRATHFTRIGERWELRPAIRERVRFSAGNIADAGFLAGVQPFDLILCRNLFIYLTEDARRRALANLDRLLAADGRLVLSPAEADRLPANRFITEGLSSLGIYRRAGVSDTPSTSTGAVRPPARTQSKRLATAVPQPANRPGPLTRVARPEPPAKPESLETARDLADAGQLAAARAVCERLLARTPGDPNLHSLTGIVALAEGRTASAAESFRKALYLDPNHSDALEHMIVICDGRGDSAQAAVLRKRLARVRREETA